MSIKKVSNKMSKINAKYAKQRKEYLLAILSVMQRL